MVRTLYGLAQSPWTERARWALDHHRVPYRYHEHLPFVGELLLRRKARSLTPSPARVTVPLLDDDRIVMGSAEIARHAERIGEGAPLFEDDANVTRACALGDRMANAARAWVIPRLLESGEARGEALPSFVPASLRSVLAPTTRPALAYLLKKHGVPRDPEKAVRDDWRPGLLELRAWLDGRRYLGERFSFADLVLAAQLGAVRPHASAPLGPATRAAWTHDALADEFGDLLAWRDAVYSAHRG